MAGDTQPDSTDHAPGPGGLADDVLCPVCEYNLRGLKTLRCPECGYTFTWQDVPRLRQLAETQPSSTGRTVALVVIVVMALVPLIFLVRELAFVVAVVLVLAGVIILLFALSGCQTVLELLVTRTLWPARTWRRFRAWWEGVLIGYAVCALTCLCVGRPMIVCDYVGLQPGPLPLWLILAITAVESCIVQIVVVIRRSRRWGDPVPVRRLLAASALAKAILAVPWTLIAIGLYGR